MRWPDFSHYGNLKLVVATLPNNHRKLVMVGGDRYQVLMENLGFVKHGNFWMRDQLRFSADEFKKAFPRMFVRSIPEDQIRYRVTGPSREAIETKVSLMTANPIGLNYLGELVLEGADGRFIRLDNGSTETDSTPGPRFLSVSPIAEGIAAQRELTLCMTGAVEEIMKGRVFRADDLSRFISKVLANRQDLSIGDAYSALSAALLTRVRKDMKGPGDDEYRLAVKLHEGLPPLDQETEKSIIPLPIGLAVQRMLGTIQGTIGVNCADNGSFVSALNGSVKVIDGNPAAARMMAEIGVDAVLAGEDDRFDVVAAGLYGQALKRAEKIKGMDFSRGDHVAMFELLQKRRDSGRSVFVLGTDEGAKQGVPGEDTSRLLSFLTTRYEVEKVAELDGALFGRSGFNTNRTLLVVGKRRPAPATTFEEVEVIRDYNRLWSFTEEVLVARNEAVASSGDIKVLDENGYQAPYVPVSQVSDPVLMTPRNLVAPTRRALAAVEGRRGNVDQWVAECLGYDVSELGEFLSAEQVDAVALAIDSHLRGKGFILADQTGAGKGRVLASLARYSAIQGIPTVFLTEKRDLFSDFWRDIEDTGSGSILKPFVINEGVAIRNMDNERVFRGNRKDAVQEKIQYSLENGGLSPEHNLYMATYSQFNKVGTPKAEWLRRGCEGAFLILDESHVAAGEESATGVNVRSAINRANGVAYSSATFAKDAVNMDIYQRAFPDSVNVGTLKETLKTGGEPLQEVFSGMLAEDGVFIRRELDLSDLEFSTIQDLEHLARNEDLADKFAGILEVMGYISTEVTKFVTDENTRIKQMLGGMARGKTGVKLGLFSMNFGSSLYQVLRQFMLAIKTDHAAEMAIRDIEEGRKPVIVVEQTMEALLKKFVDDNNMDDFGDDELDEGSQAEAEAEEFLFDEKVFYEPVTFRDVLRKVVDKLTYVRGVTLDEEEIDRHIQSDEIARLREALNLMIDAFPDLPASPIDVIRDRIAKHGYTCGELSGRNIGISEIEQDGELRYVLTRPNTMSRAQAIHSFNNGELDAIVITNAGSTGISLHASERFEDQRQRSMIELQIANNVATRLQFFGRVNRKGQVCPPTIRTLTSGLPAENRLLSMQNAKLRKLSANTTSNRDNAALATDFPDLLNIVGNEVARRYMESNLDIPKRIGVPLNKLTAEAVKDMSDKTWIINQLTARMGMLKVADTRKIYDDIARDYDSHLLELDMKGQNPFKANDLDLGARVLERRLFEGVELNQYPSVFDAPVYYTVLEYDEKYVPMRSADVRALVDAGLDRKLNDGFPGFALTDLMGEVRALMPEALASCLSQEHKTIEEALAHDKNNAVKSCHERFTSLLSVLPKLQPGYGVRFSYFGEVREGIITEVRPPVRAEETYRRIGMMSWYDIKIAYPGAKGAEMFTLSQLVNDPSFSVREEFLPSDVVGRFDTVVGLGQTRRKAILDGNMFSAAQLAASQRTGMPIVYTDNHGVRQRGVLLPVDVPAARHISSATVRLQSVEEATAVMMQVFDVARYTRTEFQTSALKDADEKRTAFFHMDYKRNICLKVPRSKTYGGPFYDNEAIKALTLGGFKKSAYETMTAIIPRENIPELMKVWKAEGLPDIYGASVVRDLVNQIRAERLQQAEVKPEAMLKAA